MFCISLSGSVRVIVFVSSSKVQLHIPFYNKVSFLTSTIFSVIKERRSLVTVQKRI